KILSPIRTAIMNLKAQSTTLADCFVQFVGLAAAIKKFQTNELMNLKSIASKFLTKDGMILIQIFICLHIFSTQDIMVLVYEKVNFKKLQELQFKYEKMKTMMNMNRTCFFWQKTSLNDLQVQVASATFLVEDNEKIIEDFEVEEAECNLEIIEHFDIENIVCLNDEVFQDGESDSDNEEFQDYEDEFDELDYDELTGNKTGQDNIDSNTIDNIDSNTIDNIDSNTIDENNANDNITRDSSIIENENEALESLPIALRKT
ncbi:11098_t:CDS:2, partial [Racocetra persica]